MGLGENRRIYVVMNVLQHGVHIRIFHGRLENRISLSQETCQSLQLQRDEMQKVCQQQQQEAVDNVSEARSAVP